MSRAVRLCVVILGLVPSLSAHAAQTLNPDGGEGSADGLRVEVGENGQLQITRAGLGQVYDPALSPPDLELFNTVALAVDGQVYQADSIPAGLGDYEAWTELSQSDVTGSGTEEEPWQVETVLAAGESGVTLTLVVSYAAPDDHALLAITVDAPADSGAELELYHVIDTALDGSDSGVAWFDDASAPTVVGAYSAADTAYGAFVALHDPFDHFLSGTYYYPFYYTLPGGGDLDDTLDTSRATDNGLAVQWSLGALSGARTIQYALTFTDADLTAADADGDGIYDLVEGVEGDTDGDGLGDAEDEDDDGDGLPTADEDADGDGSPRWDDTDGDGSPDYLDPDADDDGLLDGDERDAGADPLDPDTDSDGLLDGDEVELYGTDPARADSDGDGLDDADELARGTSPVDADTDGGGVYDGEEVLDNGTDPLDGSDDLPAETGETGEPTETGAPTETGETGAPTETGETAHTAESAESDPPGETGESAPPDSAGPETGKGGGGGCGCASGGVAPLPGALVVAGLLAWIRASRRRGAGPRRWR